MQMRYLPFRSFREKTRSWCSPRPWESPGKRRPSLSDFVTVLNDPEDMSERLIETIERVELIS